jgi:hypothetical protein
MDQHNPIYCNGNICSLQRLQLDDGICRKLLEYCAIAVNGTSEVTLVNTKWPYARVTDSKHFTGFDISGKSKLNYLKLLAVWESK